MRYETRQQSTAVAGMAGSLSSDATHEWAQYQWYLAAAKQALWGVLVQGAFTTGTEVEQTQGIAACRAPFPPLVHRAGTHGAPCLAPRQPLPLRHRAHPEACIISSTPDRSADRTQAARWAVRNDVV